MSQPIDEKASQFAAECVGNVVKPPGLAPDPGRERSTVVAGDHAVVRERPRDVGRVGALLVWSVSCLVATS